MFTGIIEEIGVVKNLKKTSDGMTLFIDGKKVTSDTTLGASIAISGVCTTVTSYKDGIFSVDIMEESLDRSNLKYLSVGDRVNLERALSVDGSVEDLKKGVEMTVKGLLNSLEKLGVEEIDTTNGFDPNLHQAIQLVEAEDRESNAVVDVYQKGYKRGEKVIRYSMVTVAK